MKLTTPVTNLGNKLAQKAYGFLVIFLGLPLVSPLFRSLSSPCTHDGHLHYHRIAALRYAWENSLYFSRWLPDVVYGYGYPFFLYREAVPLYAALFPHLLGLPLPAAINLFYVVTILAAGLFMYLWVRDLFGPLPGIVSAVVYMAAPYQLIDAIVRGNQPESLALALFPLLAWGSRRFLLFGKSSSFIISTLGLALLALSHNISSLIFVPFLFIYMVLLGWSEQIGWKKLAVRLSLLLGLGLGSSLFYLGPALLELDQITIAESINSRGNSFVFNFASLGEIFSPVTAADPSLINPPLPIRIGLMPAILALLGIGSLIWIRDRERRFHVILLTLSAVVFLFMSLPVSRWLWEKLPLIAYVQFPWRFVGRAALPVAFLSGIPFAILSGLFGKMTRGALLAPLLAAVSILLVMLEALPNLYPAYCTEESKPTILDVHSYEHETGLAGIDPKGSYFPKSVTSIPGGSNLEADYQSGQPPRRFDTTVLPDGATLREVTYKPTSVNMTIDTPVNFQAQYLSFDFPGWTARIDGEEVPITPNSPEGLITFPVPAGEHSIEVKWRMTPLRLIFAWLSVGALAGILITTILLNRKREGQPKPALPMGAPDEASSTLALVRNDPEPDHFAKILLFLFGVFFILLKLLAIDQVETPFRLQAGPDVAEPTTLSAAELSLAGHSLSNKEVSSGDIFEIDLAWRVNDWPAASYQSNVWLVGPGGHTWSDKDTQRPRIYEDPPATIFWRPGTWAWDSREVTVFAGTPPGQYDIVLTVFDLADLRPITLSGTEGQPLGPTVVIGQIEVTSATDRQDVDIQYTVNESINGLEFLGYGQDRQEATPGDPILVTLFWQRQPGIVPQDRDLKVTLRSPGANVAQEWTFTPGSEDYQPSRWQAGEVIRDQLELRLPANLDSGKYEFFLGDFPLGDIDITAPDRLFDEPQFSVPVGVGFSNQIELVGYTISPPELVAGSTFELSLNWLALAEVPKSYRVFVHLVDESGQILSQSDSEPADWSRPTSGWIPGEYVIDEHSLPIPAQEDLEKLTLRVGLYEASSGRRLAAGGEEFIAIPLVAGR